MDRRSISCCSSCPPAALLLPKCANGPTLSGSRRQRCAVWIASATATDMRSAGAASCSGTGAKNRALGLARAVRDAPNSRLSMISWSSAVQSSGKCTGEAIIAAKGVVASPK